MKLITYLFSLSILTSLISDEAEIATNVAPSQKMREYGKVMDKDAQSVPRPYYQGSEHLNFTFSAAYTLWSAYQEGMRLATANNPPAPAANLPSGNSISPRTFPKSGFKAAVEKYLHYDDWKAKVEFTWFYNINPLTNRDFNIEFAYQSIWFPSSFAIIDFADFSSNFNNQFNRIDAILFRDLWLREKFIFTPHIGLVGAWEDQDLDIKAERQPPSPGITDLLYLTAKQYWWCVGPYAGFDATYRVIKHFSIFLKTGASINLAKHDVYELEETATRTSPNTRTTIFNIEDHRWNTEPMLDATLGIKLNYSGEKVVCFMSVGWECQTWFSHNGFIPAGSPFVSGASYSMQGLTAEFGMTF